jgi:hypothetical protein
MSARVMGCDHPWFAVPGEDGRFELPDVPAGNREAVAELRRYSGTDFDPASVDALLAALPLATTVPEPALHELLGRRMG